MASRTRKRTSSRSRKSSSNTRDEDRDEDRSSRSKSSPGRGRNRAMQSRSSSRYDMDDEDRRTYSHSGWFGDSEGHARAGREAWRDDEDEGYRGSRPRGRSYAGREGGRHDEEDDRYYDDRQRFSGRDDHYQQRDEEGRFANYDRNKDRSSSRYSNQSHRYDEERSYGSRGRGGRYNQDYDERGFSRRRFPANEEYEEDRYFSRRDRY